MKTTVEKEGPTKLRLLIELEPEELQPLYEETFRRLARETSVPGFRKGKAPKAILETRLGKEAIRQEFLKDALPSLYSRAAKEEDVRAITLPEIEIKKFEDGSPLAFTATVEVRPEITLPPYKGLEFERPDPEPSQEQLDHQIEALRNRFGTLEPVARNAQTGDFLTIDITGYRHDQKVEEVSAADFLYELGSEAVVPELDKELEGKRAGDILKFNAVLPERIGTLGGQEVSFSVIVKDVQAKRLPALDDEFAKTASEFDTFDELKEDIRKALRSMNEVQAEIDFRNKILEDLVDRTDVPIPDSMVNAETQHRLSHFVQDLTRAGLTVEGYLESQKSTEQELVEAFRKSAEKQVAADLILEAVAKAEEIKITSQDVEEEIARIAERAGQEAEAVRRQLVESNRVYELADDILRRKALSFLAEQATPAEKEQ